MHTAVELQIFAILFSNYSWCRGGSVILKIILEWCSQAYMQPRAKPRRGNKPKYARIDASLRELCDKGRHPHLTSWIWIFGLLYRRLRGDLTRCVLLFQIGGWNLVMLVHTDFDWSTCTEPLQREFEILISLPCRQPGLIRLRLWISLRKCSLTTYRALSKWNPVKHENSRLQVREETRTTKHGQIQGVA